MTQSIQDLSPAFSERIDDLRAHIREPTIYKDYLGQALDAMQSEHINIADTLNILLEAQRLLMVHDAGLANHEQFQKFYMSNALKGWHQFRSPPTEQELIQSLADKMYNLRPDNIDYAMIQTDEGVRNVVETVAERLIEQNEKWDIIFRDTLFKSELFRFIDDQGLERLANYQLKMWEPVSRRIAIVPGLPQQEPPEIDHDKERKYQELLKPVYDRIGSGKVHFTLTSIPTPRDAEFDGIEYEDYLKLFFEMCDQPWEHVDKAHQHLIKKLNTGNTLRFTNSDGTDLSMSIEGMTFANSIIARNVPGSEVFSAPIKDSVNGTVIAPGHFSPSGTYRGERIEDIELTFKDGKCVDFKASLGQDILQKFLETDEGSEFIGEIGIGTNPHLKQRVANIGLVEKISGSFHVALGSAYEMTDYIGTPVKVDNGNRSLNHWDITTMLHGKDGTITLDDELIMEHGVFLDPELDVLNKGWEAIPVEERPEYWKNYDFAAHKEKQS